MVVPAYDTSTLVNQMFPFNQINHPPQQVQKIYNVNLANPIGDHTTLNMIYEDILPGTPIAYTAITTYERTETINYLRGLMIQSIDGEEMTITGGRNSLLSYIKVLDINPYSIAPNPYKDMPSDMLLYRSAYPIKYNQNIGGISINKPSMGINVRIYKMSIGSFICQISGSNINNYDYDVWRELKYYDMIKDIVKSRVSPNFVCPILYKIDSLSKIDWKKIDLIRSEKNLTNNIILGQNNEKINSRHSCMADTLFNYGLNKPQSINASANVEMMKKLYMMFENNGIPKETIDKFNKEYGLVLLDDKKTPNGKLDLTTDSGSVLILLTEAPTQSIIQWASTYSEAYGSIVKMKQTGYHSPAVWGSILFQLIYAFAVLQENEIIIEGFSLENNVYIKDVNYDANNIGSWIYKVNGLEYYVPNYGYIVMIDSKYNDSHIVELIKQNPNKQYYRLDAKIFNKNKKNIKKDDDDETPENIDIRITEGYRYYVYKQFMDVMNITNFTDKIFRQKGHGIDSSGQLKEIFDNINVINNKDISITQNIFNLLKQVQSFFTIDWSLSMKDLKKDSAPRIKNVITDSIYFRSYLHNRVGTPLFMTEKEKMIRAPTRPKKGKLLIWEYRNDAYQWVIYMGQDGYFKHKILCAVDINIPSNISEISVFLGSLYTYNSYEPIQHKPKGNMRYEDKYIFETYELNVTD